MVVGGEEGDNQEDAHQTNLSRTVRNLVPGACRVAWLAKAVLQWWCEKRKEREKRNARTRTNKAGRFPRMAPSYLQTYVARLFAQKRKKQVKKGSVAIDVRARFKCAGKHEQQHERHAKNRDDVERNVHRVC